MKKYFVLAILFVFVTGFFVWIIKKQDKNRTAVHFVHDKIKSRIDSLQHWYDHEWIAAIGKGEEQQLKDAFLKGRSYYKNIEWAVEYFFPQTAKELNGPPLSEVEAEEHIEIPPSGFQVIEELLYPHYDAGFKEQLISESRKLASVCYRLQVLWKDHEFREDHVWAAMRLQLIS